MGKRREDKGDGNRMEEAVAAEEDVVGEDTTSAAWWRMDKRP